jgi:hypothetical protein
LEKGEVLKDSLASSNSAGYRFIFTLFKNSRSSSFQSMKSGQDFLLNSSNPVSLTRLYC